MIAVLGLKGRHGTPGGSTFPAVQNLLLAARALGLGGSVFNFPLSHESELRALLAFRTTIRSIACFRSAIRPIARARCGANQLQMSSTSTVRLGVAIRAAAASGRLERKYRRVKS